MADIILKKPQAGEVLSVEPQTGDRINLEFTTESASLAREGDNLTFSFIDGSVIELTNFYTAYSSENMPEFVIGGSIVPGESFFAALAEELMPAAGNSNSPQGSGTGVGTESGELLGGLSSSGGIDSRNSQPASDPASDLGQGNNNQDNQQSNQGNQAQQGGDGGTVVIPSLAVSLGIVDGVEASRSNTATFDGTITLSSAVPAGHEVLVTLNVNGQEFAATATANADGTYGYTVNVPRADAEAAGDNGVTAQAELVNASNDVVATSNVAEFNYAYLNNSTGTYDYSGNDGNTYIEGSLEESGTILQNQGNAINIGKASNNAMDITTITTGAGNDVIDLDAKGSHAYNVLANKMDINTINTGAGDDLITLHAESVKATEHDGVGIFKAHEGGENTVDTGTGNDTLILEASGDSNYQTALLGRGLGSENTINLGEGDDELNVTGTTWVDSYGRNTFDAGEGNDNVTFENADGAYTPNTLSAESHGKNSIDLGIGNDTLTISADDGKVALDANTGGQNIIDLGSGDDELIIDGNIFKDSNLLSENSIDGGEGDDILFGTDSTDILAMLEGGDINNVEVLILGNNIGDEGARDVAQDAANEIIADGSSQGWTQGASVNDGDGNTYVSFTQDAGGEDAMTILVQQTQLTSGSGG